MIPKSAVLVKTNGWARGWKNFVRMCYLSSGQVHQTWIARKHLGTQVWRNILSAPTRDVHARRELEEIALGIGRNVHYIPHMPHDDLGSATPALWGHPAAAPKTHATWPP